ncbi:MAG: phosphatase PAP2 family protein [Burkholderiales bacterium]|nr:phosphatase PAP2 family protein [Burkholderiales bacterium]MBK8667581.1 phosphatase PAP2 family protein [Burkholderiales bacterium]
MNGIDQTAFLWLNLSASAPAWLLAVARGISLQLPHWMLAATLTVALAGRPAWRRQAWRVLLSMVLAAGAAALLKRGLHFPRPFTLGLGTLWVPHGASAGFPSAHSATAMAFAVSAALAPVRWPARVLVFAAALAMGWSRIALGVHFPSDVLAAWCLGTACALLVQRLTAPAARRWPWIRVS